MTKKLRLMDGKMERSNKAYWITWGIGMVVSVFIGIMFGVEFNPILGVSVQITIFFMFWVLAMIWKEVVEK